MKTTTLVFAALLIAGGAYAKEGDAVAPADQQTPAGAADAPQNKQNKPEAAKPSTPSAAERKAYARKLAIEMRRHTPQSSKFHGTASVRFTVGASGRIASHKIVKSSDPSLAPLIERILSSIHTSPPPGGSFAAQQDFVFH